MDISHQQSSQEPGGGWCLSSQSQNLISKLSWYSSGTVTAKESCALLCATCATSPVAAQPLQPGQGTLGCSVPGFLHIPHPILWLLSALPPQPPLPTAGRILFGSSGTALEILQGNGTI